MQGGLVGDVAPPASNVVPSDSCVMVIPSNHEAHLCSRCRWIRIL